MASSGDEINRSEHERIRFIRTAADTSGELLEVSVTYRPQSPRPPMHYHPNQEERFEVVRGRVHTNIGGEEVIYHAGDMFIVPPGVPHWMHNTSDEQGEVLWQTRPALRTEFFFETIWNLVRDGRIDEPGPGLLHAAVLGREYADEFRLAGPPYYLQRMAFALLAPVGKLLGYRAHYR